MADDSSVSFALSEEQELMRDEVRRFAEERIRPGVAERDKNHEFPAEIVQEMGELGLLGMMVDEAYDGTGVDVGRAHFNVFCVQTNQGDDRRSGVHHVYRPDHLERRIPRGVRHVVGHCV